MKRIVGLVIVSVALMTVNVSCQNIESKEKAVKQHANKLNQNLKNNLDLDAQQEVKWDEIYKKQTEKFRKLRSDESLDRDIKKEKANSIFAELDKEILLILNAAQQKKYTELVKQNRVAAKEKYKNRQAGKSGPNKGNSEGQNIKNELNLTEDQSEKWDKINVDYRTKMRDLRNSGDLSSDSKRKDKEGLMHGLDAEILTILDSEQQASYLKIINEKRALAKERKSKNQ